MNGILFQSLLLIEMNGVFRRGLNDNADQGEACQKENIPLYYLKNVPR